MLKSLSAKIIAAAILLITISYVSDFLIAAKITRSLNTETATLTERLSGAIQEKDLLIERLLADNLKASDTSLQASLSASTANNALDTESTRKFLEGNRTGIAVSSVTLIKNAMLQAEAETAQSMMQTLLENPDVYAINLWRINGEMAFHDNKTIDDINKRADAEVFPRRKPKPTVTLDGARREVLDKVVSTRQNGLIAIGEEPNNDGEMEPVEYAYYLFENEEPCQGCHGETTDPRGVLEVAVSRRALIQLEETAKAKMMAVEQAQAEKKAAFTAQNQALTQEVKQLTGAVNADVEKGTQRVNDTQESSFTSSLMSKAGFFTLTVGVLFWVLNTLLSKPVKAMTDAMGRLAHGELEVGIPAVGREDEIGQMASAVEVFKENAVTAKRLEAEHLEIQQRADQEKAQTLKKLADNFETSVGAVVKTVTEAASGMEASSENLAIAAKQTSTRASTVSAAAEQASTNVQTVASAAEELSSSISEISRQVAQSTQIAGAAVQEVDGANQKVQGLADAAQKIGEVVALITDIADQTNLLALNATIEAARAGDAGKGFAVVASEVKNLANQTARATEEISEQIGGIQDATQDAVQAIGSIGSTIRKMNEIAAAIAAAVEEQGAATQEIARNVEHASNGTTEVSNTIREVNTAAEDTGSAAAEIRSSAHQLTDQSDRLAQEMVNFLKAIRPNKT